MRTRIVAIATIAARAIVLLGALVALGCTEAGVVLTPPDAATPIPDSVRVDALAAGPYHTCGIDSGRLLCWGSNDTGELGVGDTTPRTSPATIAGTDWKEVVVGETHTCARRTGGSLWCWGDNAEGQLGIGPSAAMSTPSFVSLSAPAQQLASTYAHSCAVDDTHALFCWGANEEGQLAQDDPFSAGVGVNRDHPVQVGSDHDWLVADTGQGHTCGVRAPGNLWCWGRNSDGELGLGAGSAGQTRSPGRVGKAEDWRDVRIGQETSCGLRGTGSLWCWGGNDFGECGLGDTAQRDVPTAVGAFEDWKVISTDTFHTCGVRSDGSLYCWGRNIEGELGLGDAKARLTPTRVDDATDWISVAAGRFHTCALKSDRSVLCTGQNDKGQLGLGDTTSRFTFTLVALPPG
jgi:alpha-tubulin suppressor-like RCC1 family protein